MNKLAKIIEYLFYIFVFLLPWQTRWIWHSGKLGEEISQYLSFSLYGTEILFFVLIVLALIYSLKNKDEEFSFLNLKLLDFYILLILFFVISLFSVVFAQDSYVGFYYLIKLLQGFALLVFIINFKFSYKKLGWVIVLAGLVQAVLSIFQFMMQKVFTSKWLGIAEQLPQTLGVSVIEAGGLRWLRSYAALPHPNIAGGFLAISLIILIILIFLAQKNKERVFLWLFLPIILAGLFFTFSKGAWLALIIGILFLSAFVFSSKDKITKFIFSQLIGVVFTVIAVLFLIYQTPVLTRLKGETRLEQKSYTERSLYYDQAKTLIENNWLKGVGLGNYTLALYNQDDEKQAAWAYQPVHNVFILVVTETGILGFILFVLLFLESFKRLWRFKIDHHLKLLNIFSLFKKATHIFDTYHRKFFWFIGLAAVFLMFLVVMFFDHYIWTQYFGIMFFWLMFGLWLKQVSLMK